MFDRTVKLEDKTISIRMMDDRYIVNDCPQQPEHIEVLKKRNGTWCGCMGVFSRPVREITAEAKERYGNCAVIAWDNNWIVGILTFFPVEDLVARKAFDWEKMESYCNTNTVAAATCVLCSLSGHQYRRKGIGRAMAELMIEWAHEKGFGQVGAFGVPSGLTSMDWEHPCRPPMPFWQKLGFSVVSKHPSTRDWSEVKAGFEKEMESAKTNKEEAWKMEVFPKYIQEVESSNLPFSELDANYSLIRKLSKV